MVSEAEPVAGLALNFSPVLRMAPPPLGSDKEGGAGGVAVLCAPSPTGLLETLTRLLPTAHSRADSFNANGTTDGALDPFVPYLRLGGR
jgi:hypothetical protein